MTQHGMSTAHGLTFAISNSNNWEEINPDHHGFVPVSLGFFRRDEKKERIVPVTKTDLRLQV